VGKIAKKAVCRSIFDNMALYFECRINKGYYCFLLILALIKIKNKQTEKLKNTYLAVSVLFSSIW